MKNVALITGASTGIGREFALYHASKGGDIVVVARREDKLKELQKDVKKNFGRETYIIIKDLTKPEAPKEIYTELKNEGIEIEYLINNAGFGGLGKFHERELDKDLNMINLNITALTLLTRYFLPDFVKRNRGRILNVSSTASFMPGPLQAVYYATKSYVAFFSNALAEELHDTNITVTALKPGATESEFGKVSNMDKTDLFSKTTSATKVAKDGYNAMLKGKLNKVTGLTFSQRVIFLFLPVIPLRTKLRLIRQMQEV